MSSRTDRLLRQAAKLLDAGQRSEAEVIYRAVLAEFPDNRTASSGLAALKSSAPDTTNADMSQAAIQAVVTAFEEHAYEQAIILANALLEHNTTLPVLHQSKGLSHLKLGQYEKATRSLREVCRLNPDAATAYFNLGLAQKLAGQMEEARASFKVSDRLRPDHLGTQIELAALSSKLGRQKDAIDFYEAAIRIDPNQGSLYVDLGHAYTKRNAFLKAVKIYHKALDFYPTDKNIHYNIGLNLQKLGSLEQSARAFRNVIRIDKMHVFAHASLAEVYRDMSLDMEAVNSATGKLLL